MDFAKEYYQKIKNKKNKEKRETYAQPCIPFIDGRVKIIF